jgi:hypothetical protein
MAGKRRAIVDLALEKEEEEEEEENDDVKKRSVVKRGRLQKRTWIVVDLRFMRLRRLWFAVPGSVWDMIAMLSTTRAYLRLVHAMHSRTHVHAPMLRIITGNPWPQLVQRDLASCIPVYSILRSIDASINSMWLYRDIFSYLCKSTRSHSSDLMIHVPMNRMLRGTVVRSSAIHATTHPLVWTSLIVAQLVTQNRTRCRVTELPAVEMHEISDALAVLWPRSHGYPSEEEAALFTVPTMVRGGDVVRYLVHGRSRFSAVAPPRLSWRHDYRAPDGTLMIVYHSRCVQCPVEQ